MTDHLPECHERELIELDCICDRLRACEQRVRLVAIDAIAAAQANSYQHGVQSARDAVAAAYDDERYGHKDDWGVPVVYRDLMLAAIDALLGES